MRVSAMLCLSLCAACSGGAIPGDEASASGMTASATGSGSSGEETPTTGADPSGTATAGTAETAETPESGDVDPSAAAVTVNELSSEGATQGPYAGKGDVIELYNGGEAMVDLGGWKLSDDPRFPDDKTYVFPPGSALAPGAFLVLVALDEVTMTGELPFGISNDKEETITLVDAGGAEADVVTFNGADAVVSWCRLPDGTGAWSQCDASFGASNALASEVCGDGAIGEGEDCDGAELADQTCEGLDLGFIGGVLGCSPTCSFDASMCESDSTAALNEIESESDQIEVYNAGNQALDISGWILTDDVVDQDYDPVADTEKLVFAPQTSLAAKQFLVVAKGMRPGQHPFGLSTGGDTVTLLRPNLEVVDQVAFGADEATVSYCRLPDGPGGAWTSGCTPSFGAANEGP